MDKITQSVIETALAPATTKAQLNSALACLTGKTPEQSASLEEIVTRRETARLLKKHPGRIDQLAKRGYLQRVRVPGGKRSMGYTLASVRAVLEGRAELAGKEGQQ